MAAYVAAKSGVVGLTKSLALEYGSAGVTVNTIPPGFIDTPMTRRYAEKGRLGPGGIEAAIERLRQHQQNADRHDWVPDQARDDVPRRNAFDAEQMALAAVQQVPATV
jgi:NAD(P)-dependent dehydrogenase (short-subunit alcohol dehydrogenase family)